MASETTDIIPWYSAKHILMHGIISSVTHECDRQRDRRTDRQTGILLANAASLSCAVKNEKAKGRKITCETYVYNNNSRLVSGAI